MKEVNKIASDKIWLVQTSRDFEEYFIYYAKVKVLCYKCTQVLKEYLALSLVKNSDTIES